MNPSVLDIIRLIVDILVPILVLIFGIKIDTIIKEHENVQWTNQKILEKRLQIYDDVILFLNDIYCFHCYIGNWKELSPINIIDYKRKLDKLFNSYAPLFKHGLLDKYNNFIEECYETFTGWGNDAKIKSLFIKRQKYNKLWKKEWNDLFSYENIKNDADENYSINIKKEKYRNLMDAFKDNLEIFQSGVYKYGNVPNKNLLK